MRLVDLETGEMETEEERSPQEIETEEDKSFQEMQERQNRRDLEERKLIRECLDNGTIVDYNGFRFFLQEDDTYSVVLCLDKTIKIAEIPKICNGKPVTTIGRSAFISVGDIESDAKFNKPNVIASYRMQNGLPNISVRYFGLPLKMSNSLERITLPDSITKICYKSSNEYDDLGDYWRMFWVQVKVKIDENNPIYKVYKGGLYDKRSKKLLYVFSRKKIFTILEGTKKISESVFFFPESYVEQPSGVIIPSSVKKLEKDIMPIPDILPCIKTIYFKGTKADWESIDRTEGNDHLFGKFKKVYVYFYSEKPSGDSWCYSADNGLPEITHKTLLTKIVQKLNERKNKQ